ncbi:MAG: GNAT family N-acetyltransferase [Terriglobales bacterium]|jgi:ribosomal-protein-alanine N-acetyltransferase
MKPKFKIPKIETERLLLRPITMKDAPDIFAYASDPEVTKYVRFVTHESIKDTHAFIRRVQASYKKGITPLWGMQLKTTGRLIGALGFLQWPNPDQRAELGYVINPIVWGEGYVTEAAKAVCNFGFKKMNVNRIEAGTIVGHVASQRVLEKCGFKFEGVLRQRELIKGKFPDVTMYSLLRSDYSK